MPEELSELEKISRRLRPLRTEMHKAWKSSGSSLDEAEWVAKHHPDKLDRYLEHVRATDLVIAAHNQLDKEWRESMSELEKLNETLEQSTLDLFREWQDSPTPLGLVEWIEKHRPERLEEYNKSREVFFAVLEERAKNAAKKERENQG